MARPLWKGTLSFGLVSIPVGVHSAVRDRGPRFHFLRRSDKSRINYQKVAAADDEPVSRDELVKGYEYAKGRYVVLTDEDFEEAAVERNSRIDLLDFVDGAAVDDRYFDKPYYLLPGRGGDKPYALLREALRDSGQIGIAKFVMRNKPHLAAVEAIKDALVLSTMRFRDEIVPVTEFDFPAIRVRKGELAMARQLIDALAAEWDPDKYTNEYRANLMAIIEARRKNTKEPELERQEPSADSNVVDLMERLAKSVGEARSSKKRSKGGRASGKRTKKRGAQGKSRKSTRKAA